MTCNASEFTIKNGVLLKCHEQKETIIVPDGVTQIGDYVFEDFFDTKQIILPDGLIKIGRYAFRRCKSLKSITIPASVTKIERCAFEDSGIENITLPPGLREISEELFKYSEIREITIPEGVQKIGSDAFRSCHNLEKVVLPESLKEIWGCAFASCEQLKQINLPETTTVWGNAFGMCEALADENGFIILNKALYESPAMYKTETVEVPGGVEVLNQATPSANSDIRYFDANRNLIHNFCTKLVIPESVKKYGPSAFYWGKLKTIISRSPANLGPLDFHSCESLRNITVRHDVEISKNLFSYNQQDNEKAMRRLRITYTDSFGKSLTCAEPTDKAEIPNIAKGEQPMYYSNYESINPAPGTTEQKWCISLGKVTPQQVSVKLDSGKTFPYVSRFGIFSDDAVVIGKQYAYMSACEHGEADTTGKFGVVTELSDSITAKKANLVELDMVFTYWFDKKTLAACAKYLALPANEASLQYGKNTEKIYPITFMIRKVLAAASILAHPDLAGAKAVAAAKEYLAAEQKIPAEAQELKKAWPEYSDIPLWDIHVPNPNRCKDELAGIPLVHSDIIDRFSKGAEIPEKIQQYVHKYVHIGAISVMIRGGFKNLLEAYLGANPPISAFYEDALADIGTHGYADLMQTFKNHFSQSAEPQSAPMQNEPIAESDEPQPAPAQDKPVAESDEPVESSAAPAAEAASSTSNVNTQNNRLIGKKAFSGCTNLTSIVIPVGVKDIDSSAFEDCTNLTSIVIPQSVTNIGEFSFEDCSHLTIYGPARSYTEKYAAKHRIPFKSKEAFCKAEEERLRKEEEDLRKEEARKNEIYDRAKRLMMSKYPGLITEAASLFSTISGWRDADELGAKCPERAEKAKIYQTACEKMNGIYIWGGINEGVCRAAIELFETIKDWEDSKEKISYCLEKLKEARKNEIYDRAKRLMMTKNPTSITEAAALFSTISGWRDADELKAKCPDRAEKAKIYQNACDKMNGVHIEGSSNVTNEESCRAAIKMFETIKDWEDSGTHIRCCLEKIEELEARQFAQQMEIQLEELKKQQADLIAQKSKLGLFAGKQKKELQAQIDALQAEIDSANEAIHRLKK